MRTLGGRWPMVIAQTLSLVACGGSGDSPRPKSTPPFQVTVSIAGDPSARTLTAEQTTSIEVKSESTLSFGQSEPMDRIGSPGGAEVVVGEDTDATAARAKSP